MAVNIDKRRKIRALEAKRDQQLQNKQNAASNLVKIRAELKSMKKR